MDDAPLVPRSVVERAQAAVARARSRWRRGSQHGAPGGGIRIRLVWWFVVVLALASAASILMVRQVLVQRLDMRIETELHQRADEIRRLANGNDPESGLPFGDRIDRVFEVFLEQNVPASHETIVTFIDGRLHLHGPTRTGSSLQEDVDLAARWAKLAAPERGRVATAAGTVEYLAVPFQVGRQPSGVFVAVTFRDLLQADADAATVAAAIMGLIVLLGGSILTIRIVDRLLARVRAATTAARLISETNLSRRIPVTGDDEISELAGTVNEMLSRIDTAFAAQRRFVDDAGHELRTPITVIRGHLDLMDEDPNDRRRTLDLVADQLDRMTHIVDDVVTLARSEHPDFLSPRAVDVDELTVRTFQDARGLGPRDWRLDAVATTRVVLDQQRIRQAILALSSNAVRRTAAGELIAIGSSTEAGQLRLWVRHAGPDLTVDESHQVLERSRRDIPGYSRSDGAGPGLSIATAIAEAHGGSVEVTRGPAETVFAIVMPAVLDDTVA